MFSEITQRISSCIQDISFDIHPECHEKVNDYRGAHGKKRNVNKVFPDGGSGNPHSFTNRIAHTEYVPFNKMFETFHFVKIKYLMFAACSQDFFMQG